MEHRRSGSRLRGLFSRLSTRDEAKGQIQDRPKEGPRFLAPPSRPDAPTATPTYKPIQPYSRSRGLWDDAFDAASSSSSAADLKSFANVVREDIQQQSTTDVGVGNVKSKASPELQICRDVLQIAKDQETKYKDKHWSLSSSRDVNLGQVYGQVVAFVQKFVGIGDVIAQIDPVHVGLPWAAIRLILLVSTSKSECDVVVLDGLGTIAKLIFRFSVFENYYLNVQPHLPDELQKGIKGPLVSLYGSAALFLLEAQRYFKRDVATRSLKAIATTDRFQKFLSDIKKYEEEIQNYERLGIKKFANDQYLALRTFIGNYDDHLRQQEREIVLDWISDIDYRSHHNAVLDRLMAGTGNWLFKKEQYMQWDRSHRSSLLWLRGDAGTGKSTIMASLIDHFESQPRLDSQEALAYFYCSRTSSDSRRQDPSEILRSICQQLSCPLRGLPLKPPAINIHHRETSLGSRRASFGLKESQQLMIELVNEYARVTVLLDALDEIDSKSRFELFSFLIRLGRSTKTVLKVIVSSRNESDIYDYFGGGENFYIDSKDNAKDIEQYVKHELARRLLFGKASKGLIMRVEDALNSKAQGIFRWVELQINSLCDPEYVHCAEDVEETLHRLPETLESTYQESLHKISQYRATSSGSIKGILRLLLCAEKSLSSEEVLGAVTSSQQGQRMFSNPMDVVRMSRSLVVLDQTSKEFRFAHLSVREFLEQHPDFSAETSQSGAAQMCLGYLLSVSKSREAIGSEKSGESSHSVRPSASVDPFLHYANLYWPRHCKKSGSQRSFGELKVLMTGLLLEADKEKPVFKRWNNDVRSELEWYYEDKELLVEHRHSTSYPANPLFVSCTYGFEEYVDSPMAALYGDEILFSKNVDGMNFLETCAYSGHYELTKRLMIWATGIGFSESWATNLLVRAARGCPDPEVMKYLLCNLQEFEITLAALIGAAKNEKCGAEIMKLFLDRRKGEIHSSMIGVIAESCRTADAIQFLQSRFSSAIPPRNMLKVIFTNQNADPQILASTITGFDDHEITEDLVVSLLSNTNDGISKERFSLLFSRNPNCPTTSRTLRAATTCNIETFAYLRSRGSGNGLVEEVLVEAMRNQNRGKAIALMLIEDNEIEFSDWSLEKACVVPGAGPICLKLLLQKPENLAFGPGLLETVSKFCTGEVMALLLQAFPDIEITRDLLEAALERGREEEIEFILAQPRPFSIEHKDLCCAILHSDTAKLPRKVMQNLEQFRPTEELMVNVVRNSVFPSNILELFIEKFQTLPVTHEVLKEALTNSSLGTFRLIEQLFERCPEQEITEELLCAGASSRLEVMNFLLQRKGFVDVSETLIKVAISNSQKNGSTEVLQMLLTLCEERKTSATVITESLVELAVSVSSVEAVSILPLGELSFPFLKSDRLLIAAAGNSEFGQGSRILQLVIGDYFEFKIPNEAYLAAARNEGFEREGYHILNMLFAVSHQIIVKEDLVVAAVGNNRCATALMELLISHDPRISITEEVMIAAARNNILGESILRLLIDHIGADVNITTPILIAAAQNGRCGFNLLELLQPYAQDGFLPQEVANAAAGAEPTAKFFLPSYWWSGQPTLRFVLSQPAISITEEVLRLAASNKCTGLQFVRLLLAHPKNRLPLSQRVVESAVSNPVHGDMIIKHLLEKRSDEIPLNGEIINTAVENEACGHLILQRLLGLATERNDHANIGVLLKAIACEENGLCDALFQAAYRDQSAAIHALIGEGADVKVAKYDIGTALHVAAFKGQLSSTKVLIEHGADVNAVGGLHRTALMAACERSNVEMVQYLADQGAEIEVSDVLGCTTLHRALGCSNTPLTECLLRLGADALIPDLLGCSAIHHAVRAGFHDGLERLIESNVSVSLKDEAGWTPLHWAARKGDVEVVEILLGADANVRVTNAQGQTPLEVAIFFGNDHLCRMLCDTAEIPEYRKGLKSDKYGVVICDICKMDIYGDRFECVTCKDCDLCYRCIVNKDEIHDHGHSFRLV